MTQLTVFTPTYNRAKTLVRTYESLCKQTRKDFVWLVIDDGSHDDTCELIKAWQNEGNIIIHYIYKENGGLHTGYNKAIENIETELCICIDSDDYMPYNAVEIILNYWEKNNNPQYAGIIGLDFYDGKDAPIGGYFPDKVSIGHLTDLRYKYKHHGDVKIVCRTDLLKRFWPMPTFNNEKNFNPIYYYLQVDNIFKFLYLNSNLCYVDYQDTGMTANIYNQYYNSPYSFAALRELHMALNRLPWKVRFKNAIHYVSCCFIANNSHLFFKTKHKRLVWLALPFGFVLYLLVLLKKK